MNSSPDTNYYSTQFQISKPPGFLVQSPHFVVFIEDAQTGEGKDGRNGMTNKLEKIR
jgi:hypothetical protein